MVEHRTDSICELSEQGQHKFTSIPLNPRVVGSIPTYPPFFKKTIMKRP